MTPDQASTLLNFFTRDTAMESGINRKVIAAVPVEQGEYKPDPKSMSAIDLAWHLASSDIWFLESIAAGAFEAVEGTRPDAIKTSADVLAYYDANYGPALEKVKALSPEKAADVIDFYGVYQLPAVLYLSFLVKHGVHHRGQLSSYLRPMGAKVPCIYGGSADEPFEMGASA